MALTLLLVTVFVLNRLDDEFRTQQIADLEVRTELVSDYVDQLAKTIAGDLPVVFSDNRLNPEVAAEFARPVQIRFITDRLAEADVDIVFGLPSSDAGDAGDVSPATGGAFHATVQTPARPGLTKENLKAAPLIRTSVLTDDPYVDRGPALQPVHVPPDRDRQRDHA